MLRITVSNATQTSVSLVLEGRIINGWVEVLDNSCEQVLSQGRELTLNLKEVSFIDKRGIALLRTLKRRGVRVVNCSGFIDQLLNFDASYS